MSGKRRRRTRTAGKEPTELVMQFVNSGKLRDGAAGRAGRRGRRGRPGWRSRVSEGGGARIRVAAPGGWDGAAVKMILLAQALAILMLAVGIVFT